MEKIDVMFSDETIEEIRNNIPRISRSLAMGADREQKIGQLRRLVDNAIRVYLQICQVSKNESYVTVEDPHTKQRYPIYLD